MLQRLQHRIRERFGTGNILRPQHVRNIWSQAHFLERVESRCGIHTIEAAAELGFGSREYELIDTD